MKIFYNDTSLDIEVNDNSYRYRAIKGEHSLTLYFSLPQHVEIPVGAYCVFEAETYTLEAPENLKMHNSRNFEYTVIFESSQAKAKKYKFRNPVDGRLKFNLTATPREHLQMLVDNMNMRDGGWTIGQCIDAPEKLISYNHAFCMDALSQQATEFETEYEFNGKQVSLWKVEYNKDNPLPLSYGRGNGFKPGVGRTNFNDSKPVEVLFVHGGEQNIDASKYKSRELLLPKNQTLRYDGKFFEGQAGFDASIAHAYISDAGGFSIQRQDKSLQSHEEDSLDLSHIYPSRVGEVTGVEVTKEGFCDFFDTTIPDALDFSTPESRFKGETMTVIFQSGMLAGKEFEIQQNDTRVIGYIHSERRFKVVEQIVDGEPMPKGSFMPVVGDKYAVFGIALPDAYICDDTTKTGASWEMFREAAKYLYENEEQKFTFTGELDGIWAKKDWINIGGRIKLGGYVLFRDDQFQSEGVGIRIVGVKDYINNPHSPEIELSNSVIGSSIMSDIRKAESNEVVTDAQHKAALQFTKRQFRDAKETIALLEAAFSNFSASTQPITVQTMQLLAGDESLQFQFVRSTGVSVDKAFSILFNKETKQLHITGGLSSGFCRLQHKTLGVDNISSSHKESEYRSWILEPFASAYLGAEFADQSYYLYAKCRKIGATTLVDYDSFMLRETPQSFDEDSNYYYMLVGILNSEYGGERSFASLYGYTEVLPGRITTDLIASSDGTTYFDLLRGVIGGQITFTSGSSGLENIKEWSSKQQQIDHAGQAASDAQTSANEAQAAANEAARKAQDAKDYIDTTLPAELANMNARLDGVVENWFFPHTPTTSNAPALSWAAEAERQNHIGDTFTNTQEYTDDDSTPDAGKSWRWVHENGYKWTPIADSDAVKALLKAAQAQDTADQKRRVFVVQPITPYDVGDMWTGGPSGGIMRCIRSRASGVFDPADWDKASKYTDDTVAKEAQAAASEAQSSAEKANNALADMANDLKFTPQEKAEMRDVYAQMELDYQSHQSSATTYGVSLTAVTSAYNNLRTYLTDIAKINYKELTTTITAAQGITYDQYRSTWKTSVDNFANAISKKFVDDVQVGGVNLLRWSRNLEKGWTSASNKQPDKYQNCTVCFSPPTDAYNEILQQSGKFFDPNSEYTLSFWAKGSGRIRSFCYTFESSSKITATNGLDLGHSSLDTFNSYDLSSEWKRFYVTFITGANVSPLKEYRVLLRNSNGTNTCYACGLKLERGNKATYYSESPEDANDKIAQAQDLLADIASDNKLTPSEKQSVKIEWETIVSEHETLNEQAFRLSLLASDYETAFQGLRTYLTPLLENLTTTSDINGPEFRALFNGYYTQSLHLRQQIQSVSTGEIRKVTIDATALDADKFYPVVFSLKQIVASRIRLYADLQDGDIPAWSTHPAGFSADVQWDSIGSGWGTIPVTRHVTSFAFSFAPNTPVGEIGQLEQASKEYIYVRGGGKYYAEATNTESIDFYPEGYQVNLNGTTYTIPIRDSITEPVVDVDYAKEAAEEAAKKLASWASDGIISPVEKTALRQQQANVMAEYAQIKSDAERYKLATADYTKAYDDAISALGKYTTSSPAEITIEADYDHIAAYYVARQTILEQISSAAKAYADATRAALDDAARQLGYADYEALRTEAAKGVTIISGGYVRTELIDTDTLLARRLLVSDKTGKVSVLPESGLQLFKSEDNGTTYIKTAEFRGEEKAGLGSVIPNYDTTSIRITEQIVTATTQSQTAIMAQGRVNGTAATPVVVTVPDIWITASLGGKLQVPKDKLTGGIYPFSYKATLHVGLSFGGINLGSEAKSCVFSNVGSSQETSTHIIYELTGRDALYTFKVPASDRAITNSALENVKVSFAYMWGNSNWPQGTVVDFQPRVCASFSPGMISSVTSQMLKMGSAALNASFFGNGLIFSKSTNQYVGMMAAPSGTQFEIRSGDAGVRLGADGVSLRNSDGVWDNSGLLCGYRVDQYGGISTRFGVKDEVIAWKCQRMSTGQYTFYHNLGHTNYTVSVELMSGEYDFHRVPAVTTNTVLIETRDSSGRFVDREFMITFFGKM